MHETIGDVPTESSCNQINALYESRCNSNHSRRRFTPPPLLGSRNCLIGACSPSRSNFEATAATINGGGSGNSRRTDGDGYSTYFAATRGSTGGGGYGTDTELALISGGGIEGCNNYISGGAGSNSFLRYTNNGNGGGSNSASATTTLNSSRGGHYGGGMIMTPSNYDGGGGGPHSDNDDSFECSMAAPLRLQNLQTIMKRLNGGGGSQAQPPQATVQQNQRRSGGDGQRRPVELSTSLNNFNGSFNAYSFFVAV